MDKGATHALITRSNTSQPSQTYLADAAGKRLAWVEQNALDRVASLCALSRQPCEADVRQHRRAGRDEALLPDARAQAGGGQALPRVLLRLWRAAWAASDRRLVWLAAAARSAGRPGLDRVHDRQPRHQPPRHQVRKCGLSRHGRCRGQGPARGRRMAQEAAVRRSIQARGDGLVIWRLHDARSCSRKRRACSRPARRWRR